MYLDKLVKDQKNLIERLVQVNVAQELTMRGVKSSKGEFNKSEDGDTFSPSHKRTVSERHGGARKAISDE